MRVRVIPIATAWVLLLVLAPTRATSALADDGRGSGVAMPSHPPLVVLRASDIVRASPPAVPSAKEVVVLVGGYQSCACDATFSDLTTQLVARGFDVVRFGSDPSHPYDTYGDVRTNAVSLRDEVRAIAGRYAAVHIVAHSMGGVVADQAFANGLSRADGVASYVAWAAPHSGSDAARAIELVHSVAGSGGPFHEGLLWLGMDSESTAVRDLARATSVASPPGIVRLDLREATDVLVTARDARDVGAPSRTLTGALEGHGGIVSDPTAIDLTVRTITTRRIPPDTRARALVTAAEQTSTAVGVGVLVALCALTIAACAYGSFVRAPLAGPLGTVARWTPRAARRRCP